MDLPIRMRIRDPHRVFLHRGIRVAIALPLITVLIVRVADDPEGLVYGSLLAVTLLGLSDIGGPWKDRLLTPLVVAALAIVVAAIGILASATLPGAIAVTFVVGTVLAFLPTLRGKVAVAAPALLLVYAVSVTTRVSLSTVPDVVLGLTVSGAVCSIVMLVVLPDDPQARLRRLLAAAMDTQADYVSARWLGSGDVATTHRAYRASVDAVASAWIGNQFRPSGAAESHHALILLASRLSIIFECLMSLPSPEAGDPPGTSVGQACDWMRRNARALEGSGPLPDIGELASSRSASRERAIGRITQQGDPVLAISATRRTHVGQMLLAFAGQTTELVAEALGRKVTTETAHVVERAHWWTDLAVNTTLRSPWARSAIRAGLALAIAAGVVAVAGLDHGYWVLLGVLAVLRIDAAATTAQAARAVIGTVTGVGLALLTLALLGGVSWLPWVIIPAAAFLAGWAGGAIGFAVGQAAFSYFVLIMFSAVQWPPNYSTAVERIVDVVVGVLVAAVVGLLVWPGNVIPTLRVDIASALRAGIDYLRIAVHRVAGGVDAADVRQHWIEDRSVARRTGETFDICVSQRTDVDAVRGYWSRLVGDAHILLFTGSLIASIPDVSAEALPEHAEVLTLATTKTAELWEEVARTCAASGRSGRGHPQRVPPTPGADPYDALARASVGLDLTDHRVAASLASSVWVLDWLTVLDDIAHRTPTAPARQTDASTPS